jgi:hypothetical protein
VTTTACTEGQNKGGGYTLVTAIACRHSGTAQAADRRSCSTATLIRPLGRAVVANWRLYSWPTIGCSDDLASKSGRWGGPTRICRHK